MLLTLGRTVATPGALAFCAQHQIDHFQLMLRHAAGDWGDLSADDVAANVAAIQYGGRVFSSYVFPQGKVWIITEADRASTCLLLPDEY